MNRLWLLWPLVVVLLLAFAAAAAVTVTGVWLVERLARAIDACLHPKHRGRADP